MLDTLAGGLIALAGVALAQWWQSKRTREEAASRRKIEKAARLRVAYAELVAAAEEMRASSVSIGFLHIMAFQQEPGARESFIAKLSAADRDVSASWAALGVETDDADRAVQEALSEVRSAYRGFVATVYRYTKETAALPTEEFRNLVQQVGDAASKVGQVARRRLAELEES